MCAPRKDLRACIIDYKADWPAYIELCGFRTWSHTWHPCPLCTVHNRDMLALGAMTLHSCPHTLFDQTAYEEVVAATFRDTHIQYSMSTKLSFCGLTKPAIFSPQQTIFNIAKANI